MEQLIAVRCGDLARRLLDSATACHLQLPKSLADHLFRVLIALLLELNLQVRPLLGIERLEVRSPEAAIRCMRRHEQRTINATHLRFGGCGSGTDRLGAGLWLWCVACAAGNGEYADDRP